MKRVIFVHPHFTLATGATITIIEISQRLVKLGWSVHVVTAKTDPQLVSEAERAGVQFHSIDGPVSSSLRFWLLFPVYFYRIYQKAVSLNTQILVGEAFPGNWWAWLIRLINPAFRVVYACHEPTAFIHAKSWIDSVQPNYMRWGLKAVNPLFRIIEDRLVSETDVTAINSEFTRRTLTSVYPDLVQKKPVVLVYNGIDHQVFRPGPPLANRQRTILVMGYLAKFKNVDVVIKAFQLLRQQHSDFNLRLVIKGTGYEAPLLKALSAQLGLTNEISFIETFYSPTDLSALISSSLVVVHAAIDEPFGLAPIEAMACGTPVVVTGTGGTAETVKDGHSGLYFSPNDPIDLARKLIQLISSSDLWQRLSRGAILDARRFTWEQAALSMQQAMIEASPDHLTKL